MPPKPGHSVDGQSCFQHAQILTYHAAGLRQDGEASIDSTASLDLSVEPMPRILSSRHCGNSTTMLLQVSASCRPVSCSSMPLTRSWWTDGGNIASMPRVNVQRQRHALRGVKMSIYARRSQCLMNGQSSLLKRMPIRIEHIHFSRDTNNAYRQRSSHMPNGR